MTVHSKLAVGSGVAAVVCAVLAARLAINSRKAVAEEKAELKAVDASTQTQKQKEQQERAVRDAKSKKIAVDGEFLKRLGRLLPILIPSVFSKEMGYTVLVAVMLLARTYCDLWMIRISTTIERSIISRNRDEFLKNLVYFFMGMVPIAAVTSVLKYGLVEMALCFRSQLTAHLYRDYLKGFTYYKISNLDNRISNADQLLTQDVDRFCQSIADLYSNISKPILDILIYAGKLAGAIGAQGPFSMLGYLAVSGVFLTYLRRPVAKFTVEEQTLEGQFRFVNSRLITNSEEIAFYKGNEKEKGVIANTFQRLIDHIRKSQRFRFAMGVIDSVVAKYMATIVGFWVVSIPFLTPNHPRHVNSTPSELMQDYYTSGRMLMNLSMAVGRLVLAGRELTRLSGFTARVTELIDVLNDLNNGHYQRTMVNNDLNNDIEVRAGSGKLTEVDHLIRFVNVPLVTPNGDVLIRSLNFEVHSGMNVLVCGPNGCGKSSLFRTLGELWPLFGGELYKPNRDKLFYVPQRPYMTLGTLRDQVVYPHSKEMLQTLGITDDDLKGYLDKVSLGYLVDREGGWDSVKDWMDVLSGGEKQRVAMARLFYHRPQFAILDECTSAVSVDVEGFMYRHCRELGITLFTVSHRKSLWAFHEYVLSFDGRGNYEFNKIDENTIEFGS